MKINRWLLALMFSTLVLISSQAQTIRNMYDQGTLEYWRARYTVSTNKILDQVAWDAMENNERLRIGAKPRLRFPLFAEGKFADSPFAYYTFPNRNEIVFPAFSLKFLDDLCTAYAWLKLNDYSLETLSEYTAILRYGDPPFPPPLQALGIPEDALEDTVVNDLALGHFVTARSFILLHEIGHILLRKNHFSEDIDREIAADQFAAEVMDRTVLEPLGMLVYFFAAAHWSGSSSEPGTHPLNGSRIQAFSSMIDHPDLQQALQNFGVLLDSLEIRLGFIATGRAGRMDALKPRPPDSLPQYRNVPQDQRAFAGPYEIEFVQLDDPPNKQLEGRMWLERTGNIVKGTFTFGLGAGTLTGIVVGDQLEFTWDWAKMTGRGRFILQTNNRFEGTWGSDDTLEGIGKWSGRKL